MPGTAGTTFSERMEEDDPLAVLAHRNMTIRDGGAVLRERHELVVMRGKDGARLYGIGHRFGDRPGDGETVVGTGSSPDLVEENQGTIGCMVENVRGFHLDHEGGTPAGEVVAGTDANENSVANAVRACSAGTNEPICAINAMSATWRITVDLPAISGP